MSGYPVISLKPSYNSVVRGCPGIPETLPRIECQLQLRSNNGQPFTIDKLEIMLLTVESLHHNNHLNLTNFVSLHNDTNNFTASNNINCSNHNNSSSGNNDNINNVYLDSISPLTTFESQSINFRNSSLKKRKDKLECITIHYKKSFTFKNDGKDKKIIGIDIPLTIALPDDIKETNYNNKFGNCYTLFDCKAFFNGNDLKDFKHLINIERYSLLPSKLLFPSLERTVDMLDNRFKINYKIENPCLSNDDLLKLRITFKPNVKYISEQSQKKSILFNKKIKLKHITFQLKELLEINDNIYNNSSNNNNKKIPNPISFLSSLDKTENVLQVLTREVNQVISMNEICLSCDLRIFTKNKFFKSFESTFQEPEFLYKLPKYVDKRYDDNSQYDNDYSKMNSDINTIFLQNKNNNIPFQYHTSITTLGNFFNITHRLTMRFKISGGRGFEINQNLTVTPWSRSKLKYIEQLIQQEKETAYFAQKFYSKFGSIIKKKIDSNNNNSGNGGNSNGCTSSTYILEYPCLPSVVYYYDAQTLNKFNIVYDNSCVPPKRIPVIQ